MNSRRFQLVISIAAYLVLGVEGRCELSPERINEFIARSYWPDYSNLTVSEKQQMIGALHEREKAGWYKAEPSSLRHHLFLLGDRKAYDEVIAEFRDKAVQGLNVDFHWLAASPSIDVIPAIADLLWSKEGGSPPGSDVQIPSADGYTALAIGGRLARSPELPTPVVEWARSFGDYGGFDWTPVVQRWWQQNEKAFREKRYADVVPGEPVERFLPNPPEPAAENTQASPPPATKALPADSVSSAKEFTWVSFAIVAGCAALMVIAAAMLGRKKRH